MPAYRPLAYTLRKVRQLLDLADRRDLAENEMSQLRRAVRRLLKSETGSGGWRTGRTPAKAKLAQ